MLFRVSFLLIFHFVWITSALQCLNCPQTLNLDSLEAINTARSECTWEEARFSSCSQLLHVQYSERRASASFEATPSKKLMLPIAARLMTNTTKFWLNKPQHDMDRTFEIHCFDSQACNVSAINDTYNQVRDFEYSELWANLVVRLYSATDDPTKLVCADNQDKSVSCPNGFCLLISSDSSSFSRSCVLNNSLADRYGVLLESKTISEKEIQSTLTYTCNKPMCNNAATAKEVRSLLEIRKVLPYPITTTTTTTTVATTAPKKTSTGNLIKPFNIISHGLVLLIIIISLDFD